MKRINVRKSFTLQTSVGHFKRLVTGEHLVEDAIADHPYTKIHADVLPDGDWLSGKTPGQLSDQEEADIKKLDAEDEPDVVETEDEPVDEPSPASRKKKK